MLGTLLQGNLDTFVCPTDCEWYCKFCEKQQNHIICYKYVCICRRLVWCHAGWMTQKTTSSYFACGQQYVSSIANFCEKLSYAFFLWLTVCEWNWRFLWKAVLSHLFLSPTGSEWHCKFCERQSHYIFSYHQQRVSDIAHFSGRQSHDSSHLFLWPIVSEWHCKFCERQSHHIFSCD